MFAASIHPQFTVQVFDGRFRRPMAFAVLTLSSTTACSRCSTSMNWAWWLPGTPGTPPAAGMFVTMMEYRQPVDTSGNKLAIHAHPARVRQPGAGKLFHDERVAGPMEHRAGLGAASGQLWAA